MIENKKDHRLLAEEIFLAGIKGVNPMELMRKNIKMAEGGLIVNDIFHRVNGKIYVAGAGKASGAMAEAAEEILGGHISEGHIIVKYGYSRPLKKIKITEAGHPLPDHNGFTATRRIIELAAKAGPDDLFLFLLSGGGSSLLADYPEGSSEEDITALNDLLVKSGASISEINAVRKHLSEIKGGQLAKLVFPATLVTLVISDVPGDSLSVIASGPTVPDDSTFEEALEVIEKYRLAGKMPGSLYMRLKNGAEGRIPENPGAGNQVFDKTYNIIIGNNKTAVDAAADKAVEEGFICIKEENQLCLESLEAAEYIVKKALSFRESGNLRKPVCILMGGETTLEVKGPGLGGRNQHLALLCAKLLRRHSGITILCGGTDGTDGPTHAAGAVADCNTWTDAVLNRIDPEYYLRNFDSFNFFREAGGHVITGPTFTNVMDMVVILISE